MTTTKNQLKLTVPSHDLLWTKNSEKEIPKGLLSVESANSPNFADAEPVWLGLCSRGAE